MPKCLSIEIGTTQTHIVEMDYQSKKPRVYRCLSIPTPKAAIRDGYLAEDKLPALAATLKSALSQSKIHTRRAIFTVFSGKIINREILLPGVKTHQINAVINANVTEYFPIELDDYKITHMLIKTIHEGENAGKHKVLVLAAEQTLLAGYEKLAEAAGLRLVDIDYAGNGVLQATRHNIGAEAALIIRVEAENAIISIIKQGELVLQRNVNYTKGQVGQGQLTRDEMTQSLAGTAQRIMDFYTSGKEENSIGQVFLMGGATEDEELVAAMSLDLGVNCRLLDDIKGVTMQRSAADAPVAIYATAIGSGLSSVGFANEKEKERNETNYVNASVLMIILCIVLAAAVLMMAFIPYSSAQAEKKELEAKEAQYAQAQVVYNTYTGTKALYDQIDYGNRLTENSNDAILDFLAELEEKLPSDVEVSEFTSNDTQCIIALRVADKETAAGVISTMRAFESLSGVSVESIVEETNEEADETALDSENTTVVFTLTCDYLVTELTAPTAQTTTSEEVTE